VSDLIIPTTTPATTIVVKAELLAEVATIRAALGEAPAITDQATLDSVRAVMVRARTLLTTVDAQRTVAKSPFAAVVKAIDGAAKSVTNQLQEVVDDAKLQIEDFLRERDRQMREQEAARAAAEAAARATHTALTGRPTAPLVVMTPVEAVAAPTQTVVELVVTDEAQIPREFFDLNMTRMRQAVLKDKRIIPGTATQQVSRVVAR
jgi:hypothetical protein